MTRSLKRLGSLKYSIFSPPSKPPYFKFCQIIFRSYLNTTVKFFERESCLSKSRNLFSGWHDIWWPNLCACWTRSSQIERTHSHKILQRHSRTSLNPLCEIWDLETHSSTYESTNIDFCGFKRDNCDAKPCKTWSETLQILMWLSVTFISISWNFGHPAIVNTLALSTLHLKIYSFSWLKILQAVQFCGRREVRFPRKSSMSEKFSNSWSLIIEAWCGCRNIGG